MSCISCLERNETDKILIADAENEHFYILFYLIYEKNKKNKKNNNNNSQSALGI